jgi:hypothetical protein
MRKGSLGQIIDTRQLARVQVNAVGKNEKRPHLQIYGGRLRQNQINLKDKPEAKAINSIFPYFGLSFRIVPLLED